MIALSWLPLFKNCYRIMRIIFDFDDTLFDRDGFLQELSSVLGLTYKEFSFDYKKNFKQQDKFYDPWEHLSFLDNRDEEEYCRKVTELENFLKDTSAFLYPQAIPLLEKAARAGDEMILLSKGSVSYQEKKIYNCNIHHFFAKIIITEDKVEELKKWKKEKAIFINDKEEENKGIRKEFPFLRVYSVGDGAHYYKLTNIADLWE